VGLAVALLLVLLVLMIYGPCVPVSR